MIKIKWCYFLRIKKTKNLMKINKNILKKRMKKNLIIN
jgi:hypothetical protein